MKSQKDMLRRSKNNFKKGENKKGEQMSTFFAPNLP
jgi:hypothetical protein